MARLASMPSTAVSTACRAGCAPQSGPRVRKDPHDSYYGRVSAWDKLPGTALRAHPLLTVLVVFTNTCAIFPLLIAPHPPWAHSLGSFTISCAGCTATAHRHGQHCHLAAVGVISAPAGGGPCRCSEPPAAAAGCGRCCQHPAQQLSYEEAYLWPARPASNQ